MRTIRGTTSRQKTGSVVRPRKAEPSCELSWLIEVEPFGLVDWAGEAAPLGAAVGLLLVVGPGAHSTGSGNRSGNRLPDRWPGLQTVSGERMVGRTVALTTVCQANGVMG
jgi:hypothetical protein